MLEDTRHFVRSALREAADAPSKTNEWIEEKADSLVRSAAQNLANRRYTWLRLIGLLAVGIFIGAVICSVWHA